MKLLLVPFRVVPFETHLRCKVLQLGTVEKAIAIRVLNNGVGNDARGVLLVVPNEDWEVVLLLIVVALFAGRCHVFLGGNFFGI